MIEHFMEEYVATGLTWVLFGAWRALPLVVIALGIDLLTKRKLAARFHCLLWTLVIVRMACPVSSPSAFSLHGHLDRLAEYAMTGPAEPPASDLDPQTHMFQDDDGNTITQVGLPYGAPRDFQADDLALRTEPLQISAAVVSEEQSSVDWETILAYGILSIWLLGTLALLIRGTVLFIRFAIRLRNSPELTDQAIIDRMLRSCDAIGCRRRPALKEVDGLTVPAVFGILRHTVCLPAGTVDELSADEFRWVLKHELAHITRRDSLLLLLATMVRACHWFNPLAWLAVSRLRNYIEQAADDVAMRSEPSQSLVGYGRLLLKYVTDPASARQPATMGLLFVSGMKRLQQRIEVLDLNNRRNHWAAKSTAIPMLVLVALTGLTDAAIPVVEPRPREWHEINDPTANISLDSISPHGVNEEDGPKIEVTYDVKDALRKLTETLPESSMDAESYVTSFFKHRPPILADDFSLADGKLTVTQTAQAHRNTKAMLHAWERSGAWQVSLECRVIVADLNIARDFDWDFPGIVTASDGEQQSQEISSIPELDTTTDFPLSATSPSATAVGLQTQEHSLCVRPVVGMKISKFQSRLLMNRAQRDPRTNILFAPKVTLFNGQRAWISDEARRPFVTGVHPRSNDTEELQPVIQVLRTGWWMHLHPEVTEDKGVDLRYLMTESKLQSVDMAHLPLPAQDDRVGNVTVQVPNVRQKSVRSNVHLAKGESLLIASPATFKSGATDQNPRATFYMITPRLISEKSILNESSNADPFVSSVD